MTYEQYCFNLQQIEAVAASGREEAAEQMTEALNKLYYGDNA